jgi:glucose/arabinose dehydrogenase
VEGLRLGERLGQQDAQLHHLRRSGGDKPAERWDVGHQIRDVEVGPDDALWMLEDARTGGVFRVTPKEGN